MAMSLYDASSGVNHSENSSPFKYVSLRDYSVTQGLKEMKRGKAAIQNIHSHFSYLGVKNKLRKQVNKNIKLVVYRI